MAKISQLPDDANILKLLKEGVKNIDIIGRFGQKGQSNQRIRKIKEKNNITYKHNYASKLKDEDFGKYFKLEQYDIGDIIIANGEEWKIFKINDDTKKLYHCQNVNKSYEKSSFHALEIVGKKGEAI